MNYILDDDFRKRLPQHTKQQRLNLEAKIAKEGCLKDALTVAIIGDQNILCDGYTTLAICQEKELDLTEPRSLVFANREEVLEWIDERQQSRRNTTAEAMAENRAKRAPRVQAAAENGQSIRDIAKDEGVSKTTIERDLALQSVPGGAEVTPYRNITDKKEPILCKHCTTLKRKGQKPVKGCDDCKTARKSAKAAEEVADSLSQEEEAPVEKTIDNIIKEKNSTLESFCRKVAKLIDDMPADEWLEYNGRGRGAIQKFKDGCAMIRSAKCHAACPMCEGDGCDKCQKTGRVPKFQYDQLAG